MDEYQFKVIDNNFLMMEKRRKIQLNKLIYWFTKCEWNEIESHCNWFYWL